MASINIINKKERRHAELYKELEIISLSAFAKNGHAFKSKNCEIQNNPEKSCTAKNSYLDQYELFHRAMKVPLISGQCLFLMPVNGIFSKDPAKIRCFFSSWRFVCSVLIFLAQLTALCLCMYRFLINTVTISTLAFVCFYGSTCLTTLLFMRMARKWPRLVQDIAKSGLAEYADYSIVARCNTVTIIFLSLGFVEHILSVIATFTTVMDCLPERNEYREFYERSYPWLFESGVEFHVGIGVILQILNINCTLNWNYSDIFVMCVSLYLSSIFNKIHEKVVKAKTQNLPTSAWRDLREAYTRAAKLVHTFDEVISGVVFTSFATNLFFICLQLFNILSNGIKPNYTNLGDCPNFPSGPFHGYEHAAYFFFSLAFILARSIVVSLIAAKVHSSSMLPAYDLYEIPSVAYNDEIQRFLEQLHGDKVALSGLNFFFVTKELILSVAGTIVTYELVLLQFNGSD